MPGTRKIMPGRALWTAPDATRALPLVRRILEDLVRTLHAADGTRRLVRHLELEGPAVEAEPVRDLERQLRLEAVDHVDELWSLGVEVVNPRRGVVVFPTALAGRLGWLVWALELGPCVNLWAADVCTWWDSCHVDEVASMAPGTLTL